MRTSDQAIAVPTQRPRNFSHPEAVELTDADGVAGWHYQCRRKVVN